MFLLPLLVALAFIIATTAVAQAAPLGPTAYNDKVGSTSVTADVITSAPAFGDVGAASTAQAITGVKVSDITSTSALVTWTTDTASTSVVRYGTATNALTFRATNPVAAKYHIVGLSNLTPETRYFFEVESTIGDGDRVVDDNKGNFYNFTTLEPEVVRQAFSGTVVGDPGATVTLIQHGSGEEVTIILPEDYVLKTPGGSRAGKFENGAEVVILAERSGDDWIALRVVVKPVEPKIPLVGVVTKVEDRLLTVLDTKGEAHSIEFSRDLGGLVTGEVVTVLQAGSNQATGLVRASEVRNRILDLLNEIAEAADADNEVTKEEQKNRTKRVDALIKSLETHGAQQLQILDDVLRHAPDDLKDEIRAAKARAQKEIEAARSEAMKVKEKVKQSGSTNGDDSKAGKSEDRGNSGGQGRRNNGNQDKGKGKGKP